VFNQLSPAEVVSAIGATLRSAARSEDQASAFERDQLMSAYSATRHLAVELSAYRPELDAFVSQIVELVHTNPIPGLGADLDRLAARLGGTPSAVEFGATVSELCETLANSSSRAAAALRCQVHAQLRSLADREVDLLADALG
jgi:hypothetical protein